MSRPIRLTGAQYAWPRQHFLTICTHNRQPYFTSPETVAMVTLQFLRLAGPQRCAVLAYLFMPDHLHAILNAESEASDFPRFVRLAKQHSGFQFKQESGRRLWQESYFDRALRRESDLADILKYMLENPIRAGLATEPGEYAHWGSSLHTRQDLLEFAGSKDPASVRTGRI